MTERDLVDELSALLCEAGAKPYIKWCADCGHLAHCTGRCLYPGCEHTEACTTHRKHDGTKCR